ncbi:hypothetical protein ACLK2H_02540 [Escherichia coli]
MKPTAGRRSTCSPSLLPYRGILLLLVCRRTLEYTQQTEQFMLAEE